jgi:acylphosphatase
VACAYFIVVGRVQGVAYRASTEMTARRLGLTGWVRNREDGAVEVAACGETARLEELERWLWQGPRSADVTAVTREALDHVHFSDFVIRY